MFQWLNEWLKKPDAKPEVPLNKLFPYYERYLQGERNFDELDTVLDSMSQTQETSFLHLLAEINDKNFFKFITGSVNSMILVDTLEYTPKNSKGETPLDVAIKQNNLNIIDELHQLPLSHERSIYSTTYPLHLACSIGNKEIIAKLLNYYDLNQKNAEGETPFQVAANEEIRELLTSYQDRKNIQEVKEQFNSTLEHKLNAKEYDSLPEFLQQPRHKRLFLELSGIQKYNFFHHLIRGGQIDILKAMLENTSLNIKLDDLRNAAGDTLLHAAVEAKNTPAVKFLCNHGVKIGTANRRGETALDKARADHLRSEDPHLTEILQFLHHRHTKKTISEVGKRLQTKKDPGKRVEKAIDVSLDTIYRNTGIDFKKATEKRSISLYSNYPSTTESFFKFKNNWEQKTTKEHLSAKEIARIDKELAEKEEAIKKSKTQSLENALNRLYHVLVNQVEYQLIHITPQLIEGSGLISTTMAEKKNIEKKITIESNKFWHNQDFVFSYLLPKGSRLPTLLTSDEIYAYVFDAKKAFAHCDVLLKGSDPYYTEHARYPFEGMQVDSVFTGVQVINQNTRKGSIVKNYFTIDKNSHRRNYPIKEVNEVLRNSKSVFESLALDVIGMIRRVAEADIDAALKWVEIFTDEANLNPSAQLTAAQIELASQLYRASNLREINIHSELPFMDPDTKEPLLSEVVTYKNSSFNDEVSRLFEYIENNDLDALESLLHKNVDLLPLTFSHEKTLLPPDVATYQYNDLANISTSQGTPLCHAIRRQQIGAIGVLLTHGADINAKNKPNQVNQGYYGGEDPLMVAAKTGNLAIVTLLVEKGANLGAIAQQNNKLVNALSIANAAGHTEIYNYLLAKGARNPDGSVPGIPLKDKEIVETEQQILTMLQTLARAPVGSNSQLIEFDFNPQTQAVKIKFKVGDDVRGANNLQYDAVRMVLQAFNIKNKLGYEGTRQSYDYDTIEFKLGSNEFILSNEKQTTKLQAKQFDSLNNVLTSLVKTQLNLMIAGQCYANPQLDEKQALRPPLNTTTFNARATPYLNSHDGILKELGCNEIIVNLCGGKIQIIGVDEKHSKQIHTFLKTMLKDQNPKEFLHYSKYTIPPKIIADPDKFLQAIQKTSINYIGVVLRVSETDEIILLKRWHIGWSEEKQVVGYTSPGGTAPFPHNLKESIILTLQWKLGIPRKELEPLVNELHLVKRENDLAIVDVPISLEMAQKIRSGHYQMDQLFYHSKDIQMISSASIKESNIPISNPEQFDYLEHFEREPPKNNGEENRI